MKLQFKEIDIDHISEIFPYYNMRHNNTCDSVFLESFIWKEYYHVRYAIWEERAVLWLMENNGKCFSAMPLCREEDLPEAFAAIEAYFNEELGYPLVINLADEFAVKTLQLPEDRYLVEEQVDSRDYLYSGEAMRTLSGKKLHKKKNRVNAFKRAYEGRYEYRRLCCSDSHDVWVFLDKWREQKGEDVEEHLDYEVRGIHDILKNCSDLPIHMGGVYVDGKLEAFSMGSYNPIENMAVIHIEKANPEMNGLYQYINQQFLLEEFPEVEWVNREDDMGLEGLRKAKMSYAPADFARKYLVEQLVDGKRGYHWAEKIENTASGSEMVYLSQEDKAETVQLWRSCFSEDSEEFIQYYYREKTRDNRVLIKKENGLILSMVHYNPYRICLKGNRRELFYLVGVATDPSRRREGHFRDMFLRMLEDLRKEEQPITYLVPVNPDVYAPLGFTFIGWLPVWKLREEAGAFLTRTVCRDTPEDCSRAAAYMDHWLAERYEMYTHRDAEYVSRMVKELASENGTLEFLWKDGTLVGLQAFWGREMREQRLLYAEDAYTVQVGEKPWNMARMTNPEALLRLFYRKKHERAEEDAHGLVKNTEERTEIRIRLLDPIMEANSGIFRWSVGTDTSEAERCEEMAAGMADAERQDGKPGESGELEVLSADSGQLISWLFGVKKPEEIWPELSAGLLEQLRSIDVVNGVFLDEIV